MCTVGTVTMHSSIPLWYSNYVLYLCTLDTGTMFSSCVLRVQLLYILAVYGGYSDYVF